MGKIVSINISREKGTIKEPIKRCNIIKNYGLENDAHAGNWHRQVSLLSYESVKNFEKKCNRNINYGDFGENLLIENMDYENIKLGTIFRLESGVELEVTQIGKLCHKDCDIKELVGNCIMSSEGIFAKVIKEGEIKVGDAICIKCL